MLVTNREGGKEKRGGIGLSRRPKFTEGRAIPDQ